jgi:hypothetical protein
MQGKKTRQKRGPGRPRTSALDAVAQARERKRRQRERLATKDRIKVEVYLPLELQRRVVKMAKGCAIAAVGEDAFRLWVQANGGK